MTLVMTYLCQKTKLKLLIIFMWHVMTKRYCNEDLEFLMNSNCCVTRYAQSAPEWQQPRQEDGWP